MKKQKLQGSISELPERPAGEGEGIKPIGAPQEPLGYRLAERKVSRSGSMATRRGSGAQTARSHGRLDREVLAKLGRALNDCFDEIRTQEVPERFRTLLQQF
jgi:hypothetical protein